MTGDFDQPGLFDDFDDQEAVERFMAFHHENLKVYDLFERFALEAIRRGRSRFSARTIIHRIRWYTEIETRGDAYKINDHWSPFYARMFLKKHPGHDGFFEFRKANADKMKVA